MKRKNPDLIAFFLSLIVFLIFLFGIVFIFPAYYRFGAYLFTPFFLYALIRLAALKFSSLSILLISYTALPFIAALFLSANNAYAGWETVGIIPVAILGSFALKYDPVAKTPLATPLLYWAVPLSIFISFLAGAITYFRSDDLLLSLYEAVSVFSPAIAVAGVMMFILFIIETAAVKILLNSFRLYTHRGRIDRLVFDTDAYLHLSRYTLNNIVTVTGTSQIEFLQKVEQLNTVINQENISGDQTVFSHAFADNTVLTMAPLATFLEDSSFSTENLTLPKDMNGKVYAALAKNNQVIGYYIIGKEDAASNFLFVKLFREQYGISSVVIAPEQKTDKLQEIAVIIKTKAEYQPLENDLYITANPSPRMPAYIAGWGTAPRDAGDLYIGEPGMLSLLKLIIFTKRLSPRLSLAVVIASIPFVLPFVFSFYDVYIPQLSAVATLFCVFLSVIMIFYRGKNLTS